MPDPDSTPAPAPDDGTVDLRVINQVDISTVTLGEMHSLELQAGLSFDRLMATGKMTRRLVALWLHESRSCERPRSWRELSSLRPFDASSSTSPLPPDGPSATSSDSPSATSST